MRLRRRKNPYVMIVVVAAVLLFSVSRIPEWYGDWLDQPLAADSETIVSIEISEGQHGRGVAHQLEEEGVISSEWAFYWYLRSNDLGGSIQTGVFYVSPSMTPREIAEVLTGGSGETRMTFLEGWTVEQMDAKLAEKGLGTVGDFTQCATTCDLATDWWFLAEASSLEGYLFPDTYFVSGSTYAPAAMMGTMLNTFENRFLTETNLSAIEASGRTLDEIVIMASIVEREEIDDAERATIAGILWKRYDNGWGLEADATLLYALGIDTVLTADALATDTPYNTRLYRGLPPTAIGNPGLASLEAALYPEESPYWFYLHDSNGQVHYATTNDEHNANKAEWLY